MSRAASLAALFLAISAPAGAQPGIGLDHVPVAVRDLERAETTYRALGFVLKPGRPHANGIRNAHVKFPDGAGIELLTVSDSLDVLSGTYRSMLEAGEAPAFVSFHARDFEGLHAALRNGGYALRSQGPLTKLEDPTLAFLFFLRDNRSPTDRPEHFAHPNGATALGAVWIATEHHPSLSRLLTRLGGRSERRSVFAPDSVEAIVVTLSHGEVILLPRRHQLLAGRPVIGVSFRVRDLDQVRRTLVKAGVEARVSSGRIVVAPGRAHGLWLEFRGES